MSRYNWFRFGIVTSHIAGHQDFLQKVREKCAQERNRFIIQEEFLVSEATGYDVSDIPKSEVRIILLYCTKAEAKVILSKVTFLDFLRLTSSSSELSSQFPWLPESSIRSIQQVVSVRFKSERGRW